MKNVLILGNRHKPAALATAERIEPWLAGRARVTIDMEMAARFERPIVTFHDAYGYFSRAFDVEIAGSIALGDAAAPGARRLRALQDSVGAGGIACVFREPQHDASIAEAIAADAGIGLGTLDPSGSSLTYGPDLYGNLISGLASSIAECVTASG